MKCPKCETNYKHYGIVEGSISLFCRQCYITTWLKIPKYVPKQQREKYADKIYEKDQTPPNNLIEVINEM